mmetsp:Transcript_3948/g.7222  ORF Transcript_3948/g.7222 Transcript_3948/m.7222 type:complete len:116 (-) Transcript_3948:893-1240(-)
MATVSGSFLRSSLPSSFLITTDGAGTATQGLGLLLTMGFTREDISVRVARKPSLWGAPVSLLSHALGDPLGLAYEHDIVEDIQRAVADLHADSPAILVVGCGHAAMSSLRKVNRH